MAISTISQRGGSAGSFRLRIERVTAWLTKLEMMRQSGMIT